jgi:sugar lactone lactonase YvrE
MKKKLTKTKSRFGIGLTHHLAGGVLCLAVISLICSSASAQNLFAVDDGIIDEFTPNGVQSTFASGLNNPSGLAFDRAGNLFVADPGNYTGSGALYKFTPAGVRTTFASGLNFPRALVFDSQGNLFTTVDDTAIYKFTPTGVRTTFATVQSGAYGLAFDRVGNLFVAGGFSFVNSDHAGTVYKFTPTGVRTTFASNLNSPLALTFDSQGNLFVADQGYGYDILHDAAVYKFTPSGLRSTVASENDQVSVIPSGLAIDGADNLFVSNYWVSGNILKFTPSGVRTIFAAGSYVTAIAFQPTTTTSPYLGNISTRGFVQTGDNVMIGGFIVQGTTPKSVIIRAIGPELSQYGILNPLANPTLELHDGTGTLIASNDNWQTTIIGGLIASDQVNAIHNSGHAPTAASEPAIVANLPPGNYTAIVRGVSSTTGVGLVEAYDLSPNVNSILGNISTRSSVQTGDNVMIGGFIVQGTTSKSVIIRAIGPELSQYGVPNPLANPTLELHDGTGGLIASNDNWLTTIIGGIITQDQVTAIQNTGHAPTAASESAIIANLPPGDYTAIVRGVSSTTGVALVEVYDLH